MYRGYWHGVPVALKRWFDPVMSDALIQVEGIQLFGHRPALPVHRNPALQDFTRETMTHASLAHPNVVQFLGACRTPPNLIMVTEHMG